MKIPNDVAAHAGSLQSSLRAAAAWRFASFTLTVAIVMLAAVALHASGVQRTVLVPYGRFSANSQAKVTGSLDADGQYLTTLARADVSALLEWQPRTVANQIGVFLTRLTPSAYGRFNIDLMNKAAKYTDLNTSETFYIQTISFQPPSSVLMEGSLERYVGNERDLSSNVKYLFTYTESNGVYAIDNVETPQ